MREHIARAQAGRCVLTGGQTGVDTLAALSALRAGLAVHLVFPLGLRQEGGPLTPARRAELDGAIVHELASPDFRLRTWTCTYLSDAVILLDPAGGDGCQETVVAASHLGRPLLDLTARATHRASPPDGSLLAAPDSAVRQVSHPSQPLLDLPAGAEFSESKVLRRLNHLPELIMQWATDNHVRVLMIAGCRASLLAAHEQAPRLEAALDEITSALATMS